MKRRGPPVQIVEPSWKIRRILVFGTVFFCAFCIGGTVYRGQVDAFMVQIILGLIGLWASIVLGYLFGAAWDDRNVMNAKASIINTREEHEDEEPHP